MRAHVAAAACALLAACASPRAPVPSPGAVCGTDPEAVLACVRQREDAVHSLRAVFAADVVDARGRGSSTTGVLVVQKPDRFRLRLMLPLGLTVFDYLKSGERVSVSLPLRGDSGGEPPLPFSEADLSQAFLRGTWAFPGECRATAETEGDVVARCRGEDGQVLRELHLEVEGARLREEIGYEDGRPRLFIRYAEFGADGMPYRIVLGQPGREARLEIGIERYEVNPVLAEGLFSP